MVGPLSLGHNRHRHHQKYQLQLSQYIINTKIKVWSTFYTIFIYNIMLIQQGVREGLKLKLFIHSNNSHSSNALFREHNIEQAVFHLN